MRARSRRACPTTAFCNSVEPSFASSRCSRNSTALSTRLFNPGNRFSTRLAKNVADNGVSSGAINCRQNIQPASPSRLRPITSLVPDSSKCSNQSRVPVINKPPKSATAVQQSPDTQVSSRTRSRRSDRCSPTIISSVEDVREIFNGGRLVGINDSLQHVDSGKIRRRKEQPHQVKIDVRIVVIQRTTSNRRNHRVGQVFEVPPKT